MPHHLLQARDVRIRHPGRAQCTPDGVSLTVDSGDVVLLLGPSGSGKSSLTLTFNGLIPHSVPAGFGGSVLVDGADTGSTAVGTLATTVGMVFQNPDAQIVTATVLDEACFGPENLGLPAETVIDRAQSALRLVGLADRAAEDPVALSGGQRQRLALAAALSLQPRLLVLDEPTANVDPAGTRDIFDLLHRLVREPGGIEAMVLVEHHLDEALVLVNRVIVLGPDGIELDGTVETVFRDHTARLEELGVWLPTALRAARVLRRAGVVLEPLPILPAQLGDALLAAGPLPALSSPHASPHGSPHCPPLPPAPAGMPGLVPLPAPADAAPVEAAAPALLVNNLSAVRNGRLVLEAVTLTVESGEFWAVIGPNGAGKTTLLQVLAGILPAAGGTISFGAAEQRGYATSAPERPALGYVFQNPEHQFVCSTVFDEVAHGLRLHGAGELEVGESTALMLERFGLADHAEQNPFTLSGGQKRRLSVATALVTQPEILLLDEPTFGQDQARAEELLRLIDALNAAGTTVVMVTHDLQQVCERASHIALLDAGRVAAAGAARELMADTALLYRHGMESSPLQHMLEPLAGLRPDWAAVTRLRDLPGAG